MIRLDSDLKGIPWVADWMGLRVEERRLRAFASALWFSGVPVRFSRHPFAEAQLLWEGYPILRASKEMFLRTQLWDFSQKESGLLPLERLPDLLCPGGVITRKGEQP